MSKFVGRVFERTNTGSIGNPIEGVQLQFSGVKNVKVSTSKAGTFKAELPFGRYNVKIIKKGYETQSTVAILAKDLQTFNVFLETEKTTETGNWVKGRIFEKNPDGTIGSAITQASIAFLRLGFSAKTLSKTNGLFEIKIEPGRYTCSVQKNGFKKQNIIIIVARNNSYTMLNVFLAKTDSIPLQLLPDICNYAPGKKGQTRTSKVILPGHLEPVKLTYEVFNGVAVLDGGIVLGKVVDLDEELRIAESTIPANEVDLTETVRTISQPLVALKAQNKLWEGGIMPFEFSIINSLIRTRVIEAMGHISNNTNIEFVPASDAFTDRVVFKFSDDAGASSAELGRKGGKQYVYLNERFDVGGIVHEILHSLGVLHEQCRNDRDVYVQVNDGENGTTNNICSGREGNFRKASLEGRDIGTYDYDSIMHYDAYAFVKDNDGNICNPPGGPSIEPRDTSISLDRLGSQRKSAPYLTNLDIQGLNKLYPVRTTFDGGHLWGGSTYVTGLAFGNIRGNGAQELVITRKATGNGRYFILGDASNSNNPFPNVHTGGETWGSSNYATCCATGDIDGDGKDEIIIGRKAGSGMRFEIIKYRSAGVVDRLFLGGTDWGDKAFTTDVAIKVDRFGTPLIGITRYHGSNSRFFVFAGSRNNFKLLFEGGSNWGSDTYATGIDFGDVDGDGYLELGVSRKSGGNGRFFIYKAINGNYENFQEMHSGGNDWGGEYYATGIAFGDVDGDGRDEIGVTRKADSNGRFFIYGSANEQFRQIYSGGDKWGSSYYATAIAMADVDGDGLAEIAVTRKAGTNSRYFLFDDGKNYFNPLLEGGKNWGGDYYATAIALGNARGTGPSRNIAVGRKASSNARFIVQEYQR